MSLFMIATENDAVSEYAECLTQVKNLFSENPDYIKILQSPAIPMSERIDLINQAFKDFAIENILSFLKILCENGRLDTIHDCIKEFFEFVRISENRVVANIYYVEPLSDAQKEKLLNKLNKVCNKIITPNYIKDDSLIGGIKVQIEDTVFDGSLIKRLDTIKGVIGK